MKLIESIEQNGSQYLIQWLWALEKGDEKLPDDFNWFFLAEEISSRAFGEDHFDLDYAKSLTLLYEYLFKEGERCNLVCFEYPFTCS